MWVPPDHDILKVRLAVWAFSGIAATKEYYEYIQNKHCKRIGPFIWLAGFTLLAEFSIIVKFGMSMFTAPFPNYVIAIWTVLGSGIVLGGVYAYSNGLNLKEESENLADPSIDIELIKKKKTD